MGLAGSILEAKQEQNITQASDDVDWATAT